MLKLFNETTFKPILIGEFETVDEVLDVLYEEYRKVCGEQRVCYEATMYRLEGYETNLDSKTIPDLIYVLEGNEILTKIFKIQDEIKKWESYQTDDELERIAYDGALFYLNETKDKLIKQGHNLKNIYHWFD